MSTDFGGGWAVVNVASLVLVSMGPIFLCMCGGPLKGHYSSLTLLKLLEGFKHSIIFLII